MNRKQVVIVIAVGFVASALGSLLGNYLRGFPKIGGTPDQPPRIERIVVYYFHGKTLSPDCRKIESYAQEAIESGFPEQLKDGRLEWRIVDYEEPGNERYAAEYKLTAPSLVLVRVRGNEPLEWRNLRAVWEYRDDKPESVRLVQRNVREFLDYVAIPGACCL